MQKSSGQRRVRLIQTRPLLGAILVVVLWLVATDLTRRIQPETVLGFMSPYKPGLLAAETALLGIVAVELIALGFSSGLRNRGFLQAAGAARSVLRIFGYVAIGIAVVSFFSQNAAFAAGVGSVTALVVAFATQNLLGNMFAGLFLTLDRSFRVGDEITVAGITGRVVEIRLFHTMLDTGDRWVFIPSMFLMNNVVQRTKSEPHP